MRTKFAVLGLVLIIALAGLSVGYAYWTETLSINGSVTTGNLSVAFDGVSVTDGDGDAAYGAGCTATVSGAGTDAETLNINVTNAYPGYSCTVNFNVKNDGSIPVDLNGVVLAAPSDPDLQASATGAVADNLAVNGTVAGSVTLTVNSAMTDGELTNFTVSGTILAEQFNAP
ncbi:MAG: SipW-dependent-type signal peptide-containing protein [Chloroflexota bacterium]